MFLIFQVVSRVCPTTVIYYLNKFKFIILKNEKTACKESLETVVLEIQLSSDYIERYLGKLDMMQESKLVQLRHSIEELRGSSVPGDATLLRFLRAREFSVEKAREMLTQSLHWRKKHQIDKLLEEYEAPQVVKDYFPGGWHHFDKG